MSKADEVAEETGVVDGESPVYGITFNAQEYAWLTGAGINIPEWIRGAIRQRFAQHGQMFDEGRLLSDTFDDPYSYPDIEDEPEDDPCSWCGANPARPDDVLCVACWGAKMAGLSRQEALDAAS